MDGPAEQPGLLYQHNDETLFTIKSKMNVQIFILAAVSFLPARSPDLTPAFLVMTLLHVCVSQKPEGFSECCSCPHRDPMSCFLRSLLQAGASFQHKADGWKQKVNDTRGSRPRTPTYLDQESQVGKRFSLIILLLWERCTHLGTVVGRSGLK